MGASRMGGRQGQERWKGIPSWLSQDWAVPEIQRIPCKASAGGMQSFWKKPIKCSWEWTLPMLRLPAGGPPHAVPFCRAAICCSFNEWISGIFFFDRTIASVLWSAFRWMDWVLCSHSCVFVWRVCLGVAVRHKRLCVSEASQVGSCSLLWRRLML